MTTITVEHVEGSELGWRLRTDDGMHAAGRTLSGALSMLARVQGERERKAAAA